MRQQTPGRADWRTPRNEGANSVEIVIGAKKDGMMPTAKRQKRVDTRNVFKANAIVRRSFVGRIIGRYRRLGPNPWDDYAYQALPGGTITVLPGLKVQVERSGSAMRMRHRGQVVVVEFHTGEGVGGKTGPEGDGQGGLLRDHVRTFANKPGAGVGAAIATKLGR